MACLAASKLYRKAISGGICSNLNEPIVPPVPVVVDVVVVPAAPPVECGTEELLDRLILLQELALLPLRLLDEGTSKGFVVEEEAAVVAEIMLLGLVAMTNRRGVGLSSCRCEGAGEEVRGGGGGGELARLAPGEGCGELLIDSRNLFSALMQIVGSS